MPVISANYKMRPRHNWYSKIIRKFYKMRVKSTMPPNPVEDKDIREKVEKEGRLIIQIPFGGLGDHLNYSSLPELLLKQKGIKTLISNKSIFNSKPVCKFVWELNPYIEFTDEHGWFSNSKLDYNFLTINLYFEKLFNLAGDGLPRVYYQPRLIESLKDKIIVNPSFGPSGKANGYYEKEFHERYIDYLKNINDEFVLISSTHSKKKNILEEKIKQFFSPDTFEVGTIKSLADVLFSAKQRYLMYSGSASLAAALRLPGIVLCNRKSSPHFQYSTNQYIDLMKPKKACV